jgi:hypothetical protein
MRTALLRDRARKQQLVVEGRGGTCLPVRDSLQYTSLVTRTPELMIEIAMPRFSQQDRVNIAPVSLVVLFLLSIYRQQSEGRSSLPTRSIGA